MKRNTLWLATVLSFILCSAAGADVITFDDVGLVHGEIVTIQIPGLTISADNATIFIKLRGQHELVAAAKPAFDALVASFRRK